jgi:hypothetical protein
MKRILVAAVLFIIYTAAISADDVEYDSSTEVLLIANGTFWFLEVGLGLDKSLLPHLVGSLVVTMSVPGLVMEGAAMHIEPAIKYFFRRENTGLYLLVGPSIRVLADLDPPLSLLLVGVGSKIKLLRFLVIDVNLSIPTLMIFQLPDYDSSYDYDYRNLESATGSLKVCLGVRF